MYRKIISVLFIFAFAFSLVSCNMDDEVGSDNGVVAPVTQIANEFSAQLPDFNFSEDIVDSYEESLRYSFSVECSEKESEKYIKAVKKVGFNRLHCAIVGNVTLIIQVNINYSHLCHLIIALHKLF